MERNFRNLLVELFVPAAAGGDGFIGTGMAVARDRILTARHVLFGPGRDLAAGFELRWHHQRASRDTDAGHWRPVNRERIAFPGGEQLDAAVIDLPLPAAVNAWLDPTARNHATGTRWESEGFADVGRRDDDRRVAVPVSGETLSYADHARDAWLTVIAPPGVAEDWKGLSGAPVVILPPLALAADATIAWKGLSGAPVVILSQVAGILTDVPPGFGGGRLLALPAARLLADADFCNAIGWRRDGGPGAELRAVLEDYRRTAPAAVGALECCIEGRSGVPDWRDPALPADALAERLTCFNATELLPFVRRAFALLGDGHPADLRALGELVQRLLAILYDRSVVDRVRTAAPQAVLVGLPVATEWAAETVLAGADGRETRWRPPQPGQVLEGKLRLARLPNSGIDGSGARDLEALEEQLRRKLAVADLDAFDSAFHRCVGDFVPAEMRARLGSHQAVLNRMAAAKLADLADQRRRHYHLFRLPASPAERAECLARIERLKQAFPAIAFLELAEDPERIAAEWEDFMPLEDILTALEQCPR